MRLQGRSEDNRTQAKTTRDPDFLLVDARTLRVHGRLSLDAPTVPPSTDSPLHEIEPPATRGRTPGAPDSRVPRRQPANPTIARAQADPPPLPALSSRERQVLEALGDGLSTSEIADTLHLSVGTVKGYLGSIMAKWDARDRVQVLVLAVRSGTLVLT